MTKVGKENLYIGVILVLLASILAFGASYGPSIDRRLDSIEQDVAVIKDRLSI